MTQEHATTPQKRKKKNSGVWMLLTFLLLVGAGGFIAYKIWGPNTGAMTNGNYLYIPTGASYDYVLQSLSDGGYVDDIASFDILAQRAKYNNKIKPGRYHIPNGISNYDLIRLLRSGKQEPIDIVINKLRTKQDFIKIISGSLEADSASVAEVLSDNSFLQKYGVDTNSALAVIIPDTYEFYWNTSAKKAFDRLASYYDRYWTEERKQKAFSKGLAPMEVMIIASIVEEETNKNDEKPQVASVYLNRLKYNMKLQADPTVKYALNDFAIKRILNVHLEYNSPYNTYMYAGLPPGPIATPSKASINAVLNAPETKYLYFCAKEDFSGYHNFAKSLTEHLQNARKYQKALNENGIK